MTALQATTQSSILGIPAGATAGFITSRASSEAFFIDGTNRAMFRFTLMNHLCRDMEQVHDTSLPPDMIRQDVSRSPGGDSRIFLNNCIGCHSGMDPMARAFAFYDFDNGSADAPGPMRLVYTPGVVQPKYFNNDTNFAPGFRTPDDHWENRWRKGQNSLLGWDGVCRGRARAPSPWVRSSATAVPSRAARSKRCSRRCVSARQVPQPRPPNRPRIATRSTRSPTTSRTAATA